MGQGAAKAKEGGDAAALKTDKEVEKKAHKSSDADELIAFMMDNYETDVKNVETFEDFYHAFYELIEKFCERRGQLQYRIPLREELLKQYNAVRPRGQLTQKQFEKITSGLLKMDSFSVGNHAVYILLVLFGVPACALFTKRFIPGLRSISDDIVIPAATSGAVVYLAKSNKL